MTNTATETKVENWKEEFTKIVRNKLSENAFQVRGSLAEFLRSSSEQFGVDKGYMQSIYYSIKKDWENGVSQESQQGQQIELQEEEREVAIKVGDVIEGEVTRVESWGAFVSLPNGDNGVVHVRNIMKSFTQNASRYFNVGDKVKADVIKIEDREGGQIRYELSTKQYAHLLPDYEKKADGKTKTTFKLDELQSNEDLARQLKERFSFTEESTASEVAATAEAAVATPQQPVVKETQAPVLKVEIAPEEQDMKIKEREDMSRTAITTNSYNEKEFQRIEEWVNKTIHTPLSPEARAKFVELVEKYSMFDVCMAMFGTDFSIDLGLLFAEKIEKKLDGGGL